MDLFTSAIPNQTNPTVSTDFTKFNEAIQRKMASNPMADFIGLSNWDYFVTITSKHHLTIKSARRTALAFAKRIESAGGWEREHCSPAYTAGQLFWVAEPHKHAGAGYHLHCLVQFPYPRFHGWENRRKFLFLLSAARRAVGGEEWTNAKGEIGLWHRTDIQSFKSKRQAEYVAKYCAKAVADWDNHEIE